jgi:hypothetical protein
MLCSPTDRGNTAMPQPNHIVRVPLPDQDGLDEDIAKYFAVCQEKLGLVPYVLRGYTGN